MKLINSLISVGIFGCLLACHSAFGAAQQVENCWEVENATLKLTLDADTGWMTVLHKETGTLWQQENPAETAANDEKVQIGEASGPVTIDGSDEDWPKGHYVWLPWTGKDGERNCSGGARLMWDAEHVYLYIRVRDDNVAFGKQSAVEWWEADSVEFWIDSVQIGLHLHPENTIASNSRGTPYTGAQVATRMITEDKLPGYAVEVSMPLDTFPILKNPEPGVRVSFAIGINDADPGPDEPVKRVAQGYYPRTWVHSAPETFATAVLTDSDWNAPPRTDDNDRTAGFTRGARVKNIRPGKDGNSLVYEMTLVKGQTAAVPIEATLSLSENPAALDISLACMSGSDTALRNFNYPPALYPPAPESYFLGVAQYSDGYYVPTNDPQFRSKRLIAYGGDLPLVTVTDGRQGIVAITMTPFDAAVQMQSRHSDPERYGFPGFSWYPSKGTFGETRRGRLVFYAQGGHVKACKIYREIAKKQGYFRTLRDKAKANPDVMKLMGAVNWWGSHGLKFVEEATAAGMKHGLVNGRWSPESMTEMKKLGWLVGEYDNYEDIDDSPTIARAKAPVAEHAVVKADGEFMTAWITRDKDMNPVHTYMKQCTEMMLKSAKIVIPNVLETYPYNTRFLDVTTATSVKECYSPVHPADRNQDLLNRQALCRYVSDELGLVTGGEHGRFWDTPYLDYHEGMMGGGMYSWPAGYLRDVKSRDELNERYLEYSINPAHRVPLFELVYHDCVVNYWYWGACSDYLHQVAPEITDRKIAMNVLYGTPPMMWVNTHGLHWRVPEEREKMIEIYRNTCKLHEIIGPQEMVSHAFLTPDRMVQETVFADGTICTVNFGKAVFTVARRDPSDGKLELGENDFYARGPQIEQWRCGSGDNTLDTARQRTAIYTDAYIFVDPPEGKTLTSQGLTFTGRGTLRKTAAGQYNIELAARTRLDIDMTLWEKEFLKKQCMLLQLGESGDPIRHLEAGTADQIILMAGDTPLQALLLLGDAAAIPDIAITAVHLSHNGTTVTADSKLPVDAQLDIELDIENKGNAPARAVHVMLQLDGATGETLLDRTIPVIPAGETAALQATFPVAKADGSRQLLARIVGGDDISVVGPTTANAQFSGPINPDVFTFRREIQVAVPDGSYVGMPVEMPFSLDAGVNPGNLRVMMDGTTVVPAQFEGQGKSKEGTLVFCLPEGLPAGAKQKAVVLGLKVGDMSVAPHCARSTVNKDGSLIQMADYTVRLTNGMISQVSVPEAAGAMLPVVDQIIVSSKETGWSRENGTVESFSCEAAGSVRAVFSCTKLIENKYRLTRQWFFYADRFEVHSQCTPPIPTLNRVFYLVAGKAFNSTGREAEMDGAGNGEDFGFVGTPDWYAVSSPRYSNVCIALTKPRGFTYWDGGRLGQISLDNPDGGLEKRIYIWKSGPVDTGQVQALAGAYGVKGNTD